MVGMKGGKEGIEAGAVESNKGLAQPSSATIRPGRVGGIFAALPRLSHAPSHELKIAKLSHTHSTVILYTSHHCHFMHVCAR
jgi:hypothetical protein